MRRNIRPLLNNNDVNCCCLLAIYYFRETIAQYVSYLNCIIYSLQQTKLMVIRLNYEKTRLRVVKQFAHSLIRFKSFWCKCEREIFFFHFSCIWGTKVGSSGLRIRSFNHKVLYPALPSC